MEDDPEPWETCLGKARRAWLKAYRQHPNEMDPDNPGPFEDDEEEEEGEE